MKISAVIPAYNSAGFIADAISSIQRQTHPVDEIIVVDDGSTDDTAEAVRKSGEDVIYIRQENQGPSTARNRGVEAAAGDWIAFLDADDQWTNHKIEQQLTALKKHPELHLIASDMAEIDDSGATITPSVLNKHHLLGFFQGLDGKPIPNAVAALMRKNLIPTGTVLAKRSTLIETGWSNRKIRYGEDLELWARIAIDHPIACLPQVHMLRRQHAANATQSTLPLLTDLVEVARSIKKAGGERLKNQDLNTAKLVADALWTLGYWQFTHDDNPSARKAFGASLREYPTKRALLYGIYCRLPTSLIRNLRITKQKLSKQK